MTATANLRITQTQNQPLKCLPTLKIFFLGYRKGKEMIANKFANLGPGDAATWPPFAGHPNDPRNDDDEDPTLDAIESVREWLRMAETAAILGDMGKARHALVEARLSLEELVGAE